MFRILIDRFRSHSSLHWALSDQAVVSASNFLTSVIVARMVGIEEFGRFMIAWIVILLFKDLQTSLLEPTMMSIGPKQNREDLPKYYGAVFAQQSLFTGASFLVVLIGMAAAGGFFPDLNLWELMLPLAAAVLADELQDFMRRYFYTNNRHIAAFCNDFISYISRLIILFLLWQYHPILSAEILWVLFACSIVPAAIGMFMLDRFQIDRAWLATIAQRHWAVSRWTVGTSILRWLSGNLIVLMGGALLGAQAIGAVRAAMNILAPRNVLINGLTNIVIVKGSTILHHDGTRDLRRYLAKVGVFMTTFDVCIALVAVIFAEEIMFYVYGPEFVPYTYLIYWLAAINVVHITVFPFGAGLKIFEYTKPYFVSAVLEAVFGILASYFLVLYFDLHGVMIGLAVTIVIMMLCVIGPCLKRLNAPQPALP